VSRIEHSGRTSLRRSKPPIKGGSALEEKEDEEEEDDDEKCLLRGTNWVFQ